MDKPQPVTYYEQLLVYHFEQIQAQQKRTNELLEALLLKEKEATNHAGLRSSRNTKN